VRVLSHRVAAARPRRAWTLSNRASVWLAFAGGAAAAVVFLCGANQAVRSYAGRKLAYVPLDFKHTHYTL